MFGCDLVVLSKSGAVTAILLSAFYVTLDRYKFGVCRGEFTIEVFFASFWMYIVGLPIWIELNFDALDEWVSSKSFVTELVLLFLLGVVTNSGLTGVFCETEIFYFLSASIF